MICVTGTERTLGALNARLATHTDADLLEVRLDYLEGTAPAFDRLPVDPRRLLFSCRPQREDGRFLGEEKERIRWLEHALGCGPGWVDLELDMDEALRRRLFRAARAVGTRVLVSAHETSPGTEAERRALLERLIAANGDALKLVLMVEDAAELSLLLEAGASIPKPAVLVGLGPAGLLSRAMYHHFGSIWTYTAARAGGETAPGQLSTDLMQRWRLPPSADADLYALLGGPGVMRSPGPDVFNALFARKRLDACYLPVVTDRPRETLAMLRELGLRGASVAMPLKERVLTLIDRCSEEAEAAGAVNTIIVEKNGKLSGELTDGFGALAALDATRGKALAGQKAAILGNGGTAAALSLALSGAGASVTLLGRNTEQTESLAARVGARARPLSDLGRVRFDILVNATSVGSMDPEASPVRDPAVLSGKRVLDTVPEPDTRLLRDTKASGGVAIPGRRMWAEQGRLQLRRWLNLKVPVSQLAKDPATPRRLR